MDTTSNLNNEPVVDERKATIEEVEKHIKLLKERIDNGQALNRLIQNDDFQKIIEKLYFKQEADRVFGLLTSPSTLKRDQIQNLNDKLSAMRSLKSFFGLLMLEHAQAEEELEEQEAFLMKLLKRNDITDVEEEE